MGLADWGLLLLILIAVFLPPVGTVFLWKKKIGSSTIRWVVTFSLFGLFWGVPFVIISNNQYEDVASGPTNNNVSKGATECQGNGDESFIRSKMSQMDRDIVELNKVGDRKYYVSYISWSSGNAVNGDEILDYSNSPCND
jgi:hypothetical protein